MTIEKTVIKTLIFGLGMAAGYTRNPYLFSIFAGIVLFIILIWDDAKYKKKTSTGERR